ncbi:Fungal specific transcription factor domain [Ceratobasidium sp. AG-Ba]|nr:Fungal specific transcription factor domain [Ceratobasidium sp. AG-Ba]
MRISFTVQEYKKCLIKELETKIQELEVRFPSAASREQPQALHQTSISPESSADSYGTSRSPPVPSWSSTSQSNHAHVEIQDSFPGLLDLSRDIDKLHEEFPPPDCIEKLLNSRIFRDDYPNGRTQQSPGRTIWRPRSSVELGEAINLWWTCCIFEYAGSTMNGLPPSVTRDNITTVWPCLLSDFENGYPLSDDDYSVAALFDPELCYVVADISRDSAKSAAAKCCILMEYAGKLDMERIANPSDSEGWWARFESCDRAVDQYTRTMPPVQSASNLQELLHLVLIHSSSKLTPKCTSVAPNPIQKL